MSKKFNSIFADDLENFVSFKKSLGLKYENEQFRLIRLDKLLDSLELKEKKITKDTFEYITKRSGMKEANYARQFAVTRDFCKYLITIGYKDIYWEDREFHIQNNHTPVIYSDEEIRMIFSAIDDHIVKSLGTNGYRLWYGMAIIIRLLWSCGLRISEVLSLKKQDINLDQSYLRIWKSKGNRSRIVVMSESMTVCLREYLEMFCSDDSALFLNTKGREIDADSVRNYYHKIQKECYLSLSRLHDLRHCFASKAIRQMIDKGYSEYASSVYLYKYMGHSNFSETEYYLHFTDIDMERIRKIADQFSQEIYKGVINNEEK